MEISSNQICDALLGLQKRLRISWAAIVEAHDLTPPQMLALHALSEGSITMGELATDLHCDASNITGIVDRLVAQQLITRQEDRRDRRSKVLTLTDKGRRVLKDIASKLPDALGCTRLTASERRQLYALISKLL